MFRSSFFNFSREDSLFQEPVQLFVSAFEIVLTCRLLMKHIVCLVLVGAAFGLDNGLGLVPQMVSVFAFGLHSNVFAF
jgi:hypothetical protein